MTEVTVPTVGESISEVQIAQWHKAEGEWVAADENLVDLETEKASVQVPAPISGIVRNIRKKEGEFAAVGDVLCELEPAEVPPDQPPSAAAPGEPEEASTQGTSTQEAATQEAPSDTRQADSAGAGATGQARVMPAAARLMEEQGLTPADVRATGPGGRILKEDVQAAVAARQSRSSSSPSKESPASAPRQPVSQPVLETSAAPANLAREGELSRMEEVRPMSMIRRTIAARLVEAQHNAALLTTFNEINMQPIIQLRNKYKDAFLDRHGVKLGFMSFFVKASVEALRRFPAVNAEIRGNNIVYKYYHDIGIAIGGGKGLVVPVLRNVEHLTFADIERGIAEFAAKAKENRLMPEDLEGGTFTISNGGVYGSLLSTPIVNPPQSAILGLHAIQDRPMAVDGEVKILPMMYVALTYDHRIIDGREAVTFLRTIKEICEDPARLFLEV